MSGRPAPERLRWGWHRLDPSTARRIVAGADIGDGDLVVDLGAGTGALTAALVAAGARVIAVECHAGRADTLRRRFADDPVTVIELDLHALHLPSHPFRVVANPPWTAAEVVRATLLRSPVLLQADLVIPRWLARRWATGHDRIAMGRSIRAESFSPPAPTGAAIAVIHGRGHRPAQRRAR